MPRAFLSPRCLPSWLMTQQTTEVQSGFRVQDFPGNKSRARGDVRRVVGENPRWRFFESKTSSRISYPIRHIFRSYWEKLAFYLLDVRCCRCSGILNVYWLCLLYDSLCHILIPLIHVYTWMACIKFLFFTFYFHQVLFLLNQSVLPYLFVFILSRKITEKLFSGNRNF